MPVDVGIDQHWEETDYVLMARIVGASGANVTQAVVSSIAIRVFDHLTEEQVGDTLTPSVAATIYDTLQTEDPLWTEDSTGYNFKATIPATYFATGGQRLQIETIITPATGNTFPGPVRLVDVVNLLSY